MSDANDDVLDLLDYAWDRLAARMDGLTDGEWRWNPSSLDPDVSIRWRLEHLVAMLTESRTASWLGSGTGLPVDREAPSSAASACARLSAAFGAVRDIARTVDLDQEIGQAAGQFGRASRRSFLLHIVDELIHHGAEAALLRDLYSSNVSSG